MPQLIDEILAEYEVAQQDPRNAEPTSRAIEPN